MGRFFLMVMAVMSVSACAYFPGKMTESPAWQARAASFGAFHFDWSLSGDRDVAPMQVFDDGHEIWLHFAQGAPIPAIFAVTQGNEHLLPMTSHPPYVVVAGQWSCLHFRGGAKRALALRVTAGTGDAQEGC